MDRERIITSIDEMIEDFRYTIRCAPQPQNPDDPVYEAASGELEDHPPSPELEALAAPSGSELAHLTPRSYYEALGYSWNFLGRLVAYRQGIGGQDAATIHAGFVELADEFNQKIGKILKQENKNL